MQTPITCSESAQSIIPSLYQLIGVQIQLILEVFVGLTNSYSSQQVTTTKIQTVLRTPQEQFGQRILLNMGGS